MRIIKGVSRIIRARLAARFKGMPIVFLTMTGDETAEALALSSWDKSSSRSLMASRAGRLHSKSPAQYVLSHLARGLGHAKRPRGSAT